MINHQVSCLIQTDRYPLKKTYDHKIECHHRETFSPISFGVSRDIVDDEHRSQKSSDFEEICKRLIIIRPDRPVRGVNSAKGDPPKSKLSGFPSHHPNKTKNGIQNRVNWILRSIERPFANGFTGTGWPCRR